MNSDSTRLIDEARQLVEQATVLCTHRQEFAAAEVLLQLRRGLCALVPEKPPATPIP